MIVTPEADPFFTDATIDAVTFRTMRAHHADEAALLNPDAVVWDSGNPGAVAAWARAVIRYPIAGPIEHFRILNHDCSRFGVVILHNQSEHGDAELIVFASPGLRWSRATIRFLARWMFWQLDLRRVTLRIRGNDVNARDYARRLGFRHEGVQRRWFADDVDCSLWGMLRTECTWLRQQTK